MLVRVDECKAEPGEGLQRRQREHDDGVVRECGGRGWREQRGCRRLADEVEQGALDEPRLGDLGQDVVDEQAQEDLADEDALRLGIPVFFWEGDDEHAVEDLAVILPVDGTGGRQRHVWLEPGEQRREGRRSARGVRGVQLGLRVAVVGVVLREDGGDVVEHERGRRPVLGSVRRARG